MEHLVMTPNVKYAVIALYGVIFLAMGVLKFLQFMKKDVENFLIRLRAFFVMVLLFTGAFCSNKLCAFLFIMLISYLSLKEFLSVIPTRKTDRRVMLWAYLAIPVQFYIIYINWVTLFYLFIPLYMFILLSMRMVMVSNTDGFLKNLAVLQWGLMTTVYSLGYLAMLLIIPNQYNPHGGGLGLIFFILFITIFNDCMQMICGKLLGKHKIIPKVSPNKTWEGFIGGVIATTLMSAGLAPFLTPLTLGQSVFGGAVLAVFGFFGDVTMSAIKRDMGVKDTSNLIPGHGGILDRLDSLIFTAPLFFHYVAYINTIIFTK